MSRGLAPVAFAVALVCAPLGCNAIFGLDPVTLRDDGGAAGHGGAGGMGGGLVACGEGSGFDGGLIHNGGFEVTADPDYTWAAQDIIYDDGTTGACEGSVYASLQGCCGPDVFGYLWNYADALPLLANHCVAWSLWARTPADPSAQVQIYLNVHGTDTVESNQLGPVEGITVASPEWARFEGLCEARVPATLMGYAVVRVYVEKSKYLHLDAFQAVAVPCPMGAPPCPSG